MDNSVFVAVNNKANEFVNKYKWLIVKACMSVGLQASDHYIVIDDLACKYANGTLNYDETRCQGKHLQQLFYLTETEKVSNTEIIDALRLEAQSRDSQSEYKGLGEEKHGIGFGA